MTRAEARVFPELAALSQAIHDRYDGGAYDSLVLDAELKRDAMWALAEIIDELLAAGGETETP